MSKVLHPNENEFLDFYQNAELLFIDFFAEWCGPCKMLAPSIDKLADEHPEATVVKIDVDATPLLAAKFNVQSIPSLFVVKQAVRFCSLSCFREYVKGIIYEFYPRLL